MTQSCSMTDSEHHRGTSVAHEEFGFSTRYRSRVGRPLGFLRLVFDHHYGVSGRLSAPILHDPKSTASPSFHVCAFQRDRVGDAAALFSACVVGPSQTRKYDAPNFITRGGWGRSDLRNDSANGDKYTKDALVADCAPARHPTKSHDGAGL